jgi:hypothetical protein
MSSFTIKLSESYFLTLGGPYDIFVCFTQSVLEGGASCRQSDSRPHPSQRACRFWDLFAPVLGQANTGETACEVALYPLSALLRGCESPLTDGLTALADEHEQLSSCSES